MNTNTARHEEQERTQNEANVAKLWGKWENGKMEGKAKSSNENTRCDAKGRHVHKHHKHRRADWGRSDDRYSEYRHRKRIPYRFRQRGRANGGTDTSHTPRRTPLRLQLRDERAQCSTHTAHSTQQKQTSMSHCDRHLTKGSNGTGRSAGGAGLDKRTRTEDKV